MVRAARTLLNSVTRVLLLADIVVVKQLLLAKDKVNFKKKKKTWKNYEEKVLVIKIDSNENFAFFLSIFDL